MRRVSIERDFSAMFAKITNPSFTFLQRFSNGLGGPHLNGERQTAKTRELLAKANTLLFLQFDSTLILLTYCQASRYQSRSAGRLPHWSLLASVSALHRQFARTAQLTIPGLLYGCFFRLTFRRLRISVRPADMVWRRWLSPRFQRHSNVARLLAE